MRLLLAIALLCSPLLARTYSTTCTGTENPISEGGNWTGGQSAGGNLWGNVQKGGGNCWGVSEPTTFGDPTAVVTGSWGTTQTITETVKINSAPSICCHEVEARLLTNITTSSITGYELLCSVATGDPYIQLVRWNGANGDFTQLDQAGSVPACKDGDVLIATATVSGSTVTFTLKVNGTLQTFTNCSCTNPHDSSASAILSGAPGMGFYDNQSSNPWSNLFGFSAWSVDDGLPVSAVGVVLSEGIKLAGGATAR